MRLDHLRDYLTMGEVALRWKATDPEMCRAVLKGLLRPSVYLNTSLQRATVSESGSIDLAGAEPEAVRGWHYLTPIQQVGALNCTAQTIAVVPDVVAGSAIWALHRPMDMAAVLSEAVVMADDILYAESLMDAETCWQQRSAKTKEFNSVLNILSVVLADAYRFDPRVRSGLAREITEASTHHGIALSNGTVSKWIGEAFDRFTPNYINEPLERTDSEAQAIKH